MRSPHTLIILALCLFASHADADSRRMLIEPPFSMVQIAPDGQHIVAYETGPGGYSKIAVYSVGEQKTDRVTVSNGKGGEAALSDVRWVGSQHLAILSNGENGDKWLHFFKLGDRAPTRIAKEGNRRILSTNTESSQVFLIETLDKDGSKSSRILAYDASQPDAAPTELYATTSADFDAVLNSDGSPTLLKLKRDDSVAWYKRDPKTLEETKLNSIPSWAKVRGIDAKTGHAIISGHFDTQYPSIYVCNLEQDKRVQVLADNESYSIDRYGETVFDPANGNLVGLHLDNVERRSFWSDSAIGYIQSQIDAELSGSVNRIIGWSDDRSQALVQRYIPSFPSPILHVDLAKNAYTPVFLNGPPVKPDELEATRVVEIPNRDGAVMQAALTLPPKQKPSKLPLVLWIRPGVWSDLERAEWHPVANFFAAEGYVVLRINYSGSEGILGPLAANHAEKAGVLKTFQDLEDAAKALTSAGIVDPDKICIAGEAEGAWAAAYAPVVSPDLYKAVLLLNGVYDLAAYHEKGGAYTDISGGMNYPFANADSKLSKFDIESLSPIQNLDTYAKSAFVSLGKWSAQDFKSQTLDFVKQLKKNKVNTKTYEGDWWGTQLSGGHRTEAFLAASKVLKSATK